MAGTEVRVDGKIREHFIEEWLLSWDLPHLGGRERL